VNYRIEPLKILAIAYPCDRNLFSSKHSINAYDRKTRNKHEQPSFWNLFERLSGWSNE